jgi:DNA-directed RNA polymerase III subunit RPC2
MGMESEQEFVQIVGSQHVEHLGPSLQDAFDILTQTQALEFIGSKIRTRRFQRTRSKADIARDALADTILSHVPTQNFNFQSKCAFLALMVRRIIIAIEDPTSLGKATLHLSS